MTSALLVCALTVAVYSNAAPSAFVHDDKLVVPPNLGRGLAALPEVFREPAWAAANVAVPTYRPLLVSSFVLEGRLLGGRPAAMHWTNVVLHVAATLLVFVLLEQIAGRLVGGVPEGTPPRWRRVPSVGGALLFGVHPIHTEAVNSIFNRSEILATIGVVGALWVLFRHVDRRPAFAWGFASLAYLLALLSRESAVTLPALAIVMLGLLKFEGPLRERARRLAPAFVLAAPLGAYLLLRHAALSPARGSIARAAIPAFAPAEGVWGRLSHAAIGMREAVRMLFWPHPLRCSYGDMLPVGVPEACVVLALLLGCAIVSLRRAPAVAAAIGFFCVAFAPSTRLVGDAATVVLAAERYLYLPSVGLSLALAWGLAAAARSGMTAIFVGPLAVVLGLLGWLTFDRNEDWQSEESLWRAEVRTSPSNGEPWMQLTTELLRADRAAEVVRLCEENLPRVQKFAQFYNNCALAAVRTGRYATAESLYREAIALGAGSVGHANLARLLARIDRPADAAVEFQAAIDAEPGPAMKHVRRGEMLLRLFPARGDEARAEFEAALRIDPDFAPARQWLARMGVGQSPAAD